MTISKKAKDDDACMGELGITILTQLSATKTVEALYITPKFMDQKKIANNSNPVSSTNIIAGHGLSGGGTTNSSSVTLNLDIGAISDSSYTINSSSDHMLIYENKFVNTSYSNNLF